MPRLSDVLAREAAGPSSAAAAPQQPPAGATQDAADEEVAALARGHARRLREHGPRSYRHPDGSLRPSPPPREPLTVANRRRWRGLVEHCRRAPGVDPWLERAGVSARYGVDATHAQHAAALEAIGLAPEFDADGQWAGLEPGVQDPLAGAAAGHPHPLAAPDWAALTASVLRRAVAIHGEATLDTNAWRDIWDAVGGGGGGGARDPSAPQSPSFTLTRPVLSLGGDRQPQPPAGAAAAPAGAAAARSSAAARRRCPPAHQQPAPLPTSAAAARAAAAHQRTSSPLPGRPRRCAMAQLFADAQQAASYAAHRPAYPPALYDAIAEFAGAGAPRALAVDVACGSGQATVALADAYERVVGLDGSAAQLARADRGARGNVEYAVGDAHATGLPDACADLVTVAQALHWFDPPRFYREARRVLKPDGVLAAWTYGLPILIHRQHPAQARGAPLAAAAPARRAEARPAGAPAAAAPVRRAEARAAARRVQEVLLRFYGDTLAGCWAPERAHVERAYRGIEPAPSDFGVVARRELESSRVQSVDELARGAAAGAAGARGPRERRGGARGAARSVAAHVRAAGRSQVGYLRSWSAHATFLQRHPEQPDPLIAVRQQLMDALGASDASATLTVVLPITLILAKERRPLEPPA
ncbi:methyltransferase [Scenedesmus sp. PABB004]|nr:methyltransferase [Scenedesmus sp. PABB004]